MIGHGADAAPHLRHRRVLTRRRQSERQAHGATGRVGAPERGVDRQERQQPPHLGVAHRVGQVAIDHVHDRAEHGGADRLALGLVGRAGEHLVERLRRGADLEAPERAARRLGPVDDLGQPEHRIEAEVFTEVLGQPVEVGVEDHRRLVAGSHAHRAHVGLEDRAGVEAEVGVDLVRHRELDRTGQLEPVPADQLGGRRHAPGELVLLEAEHPHPGPSHHGSRGEPVVAGPDDDGIVVRHRRDDVTRALTTSTMTCSSTHLCGRDVQLYTRGARAFFMLVDVIRLMGTGHRPERERRMSLTTDRPPDQATPPPGSSHHGIGTRHSALGLTSATAWSSAASSARASSPCPP